MSGEVAMPLMSVVIGLLGCLLASGDLRKFWYALKDIIRAPLSLWRSLPEESVVERAFREAAKPLDPIAVMTAADVAALEHEVEMDVEHETDCGRCANARAHDQWRATFDSSAAWPEHARAAKWTEVRYDRVNDMISIYKHGGPV